MNVRVFLDLEVGYCEADLVGLLQDLVGHVAHVALQWVACLALNLEQCRDLGDQTGVVLGVHLRDELLFGLRRSRGPRGGRRWFGRRRRADEFLEALDHVGVAAFGALTVGRAEQFLEVHLGDLPLRVGSVLLGDQLLLKDVGRGLCLLQFVAGLLDQDLLGGALFGQAADIEFDQHVARLH